MNRHFARTACAVAACMALGQAGAQQAAASSSTGTETVVVTAKRAQRVSKGATGLPLELKDTPQTISTIDAEDIGDFGLTGSNEALALGTGLNVEQYETNRAVFNARGFEVQLTQLDGLGVANSWGTVTGQQDTYLFERIELIRGANGLLTGVGNASGTINYVRKRPKNADGGEAGLTLGSWDKKRVTLDVNKVLTPDGSWAGRLVVAHEDKDSYLRALKDKRTTIYGVVDGQIGRDGVLTAGLTYQDGKQRSPMWGSLTLNYADGSMADFDASSSTSVDWTFWNTRTLTGFVEYAHSLSPDWELKLTYSQQHTREDTQLLYAYPGSGSLNADNTGLIGWPYASHGTTDSTVLDANLSGRFKAFGRQHSLIAGLSHSRSKNATDALGYDSATYQFLPLPAFPYAGNAYPEPVWGAVEGSNTGGEQQLTRLYAASRWDLGAGFKGILGVNAVKLQREGNSRYGTTSTVTSYPDTNEVSPYVGLTYDLTPDALVYASYSDIGMYQEQVDINRVYLDPVRGVNQELGVKAEWLDKKLLTTFALFSAKQKGLATYAGTANASTTDQDYYYVPKDVTSRGIELEATGRIGKDSKIVVGYTRLKLTGPDGNDIYEWVPRTTVNLLFDTRPAALPALKLGVAARWRSKAANHTNGIWQDSYLIASVFASYDLGDKATLRLNVNNLFDKKYVGGLAYGAIYGAPRNAALTLNYRF